MIFICDLIMTKNYEKAYLKRVVGVFIINNNLNK